VTSEIPPKEPYWEVHPGRGPHILLLHGLLCSRAQWLLNIDALAKVAQPVIVELWGHGRSAAPEDPAYYRPEGYLNAFEAIRKRLGVSKWLICGQSLGAGITMRYALRYPERCIAQIFTNSTSALSEPDTYGQEGRDAEALAEAVFAQGREGIEKLPVHPAHARHLGPGVKEALLQDARIISPLGVANALRYTLPAVSVRREVSANCVPSLLVYGKRETRFLPFRDYAAACMPLLEITALDAGHAVNAEAADGFNRAAEDFIVRYAHTTHAISP